MLAAGLAKGLEFDIVVVLEPAAIVGAEPRGLHRLYVVLTRAVSRLVVLHTQPLPEPSPVPLSRHGFTSTSGAGCVLATASTVVRWTDAVISVVGGPSAKP